MLKRASGTQWLGIWFAAIAAVAILTVLLGATVTVSAGLLLAVVAMVPPAVMLFVWRGDPPVTVAELLHDVDGQTQENRR
ncbi:MAG TPA: hypothetical protein VNE16_10500 [Vicinamibacterales bacterium]|nr:hypothetical protein [Vicinamibacterales bacterium]